MEPTINGGEPIRNRGVLLKFICQAMPEVREELKLYLRPNPNIPPQLKQTKKNAELENGSGTKKKKKGKKGKRNR